jgi:hypothetical protein
MQVDKILQNLRGVWCKKLLLPTTARNKDTIAAAA